MSQRLSLHCGGRRVTRDQLAEVTTPTPTRTHYPIAHAELVRQTIEQLEGCGARVTYEDHGVSHEDKRYFGIFGIAGGDGASATDGWGLVIGLRNSHDKSFQATLALGSHVFVCDNLAFSGEVTIARKHTRHILRDLPGLMTAAVAKIVDQRQLMRHRVATYKAHPVSDRTAHDTIIRAIDQRIIAPPRIPHVLKEWRTPTHEDFAPRNAWSLFNAFTDGLKDVSAETMYRRTQPLHGLFDTLCGLAVTTN